MNENKVLNSMIPEIRKYYDNFKQKIRNSTYKKNESERDKNLSFLTKKRNYLDKRRKTAKGRSNELKIQALSTIIGILSRFSYRPTIEYTIEPTLSQGDCFYSSVYRVSKERDLLDHIKTCLKVEVENEDQFVITMRNLVATEIKENRLISGTNHSGKKEDAYDFLSALLTGLDKEDYNESITQFTTQFKRAFPYSKGLGTRESFLEKMSKIAAKRQNFVSEIEVQIMINQLNKCKIKLAIHNNSTPVIKIKEGDYEVINIYNQGEGHYVYFSTAT